MLVFLLFLFRSCDSITVEEAIAAAVDGTPSCSATVVQGASEQVIHELRCEDPNKLLSLHFLQERFSLSAASGVEMYMTREAALKLEAVFEQNPDGFLTIEGAYRSPITQTLLNGLGIAQKCKDEFFQNLDISGTAGASEHEKALTLDMSDANVAQWTSFFTANGFSSHLHGFKYDSGPATNVRSDAIVAFKKLHNAQSGVTQLQEGEGATSEFFTAIANMPVGGFQIHSACAKDNPSSVPTKLVAKQVCATESIEIFDKPCGSAVGSVVSGGLVEMLDPYTVGSSLCSDFYYQVRQSEVIGWVLWSKVSIVAQVCSEAAAAGPQTPSGQSSTSCGNRIIDAGEQCDKSKGCDEITCQCAEGWTVLSEGGCEEVPQPLTSNLYTGGERVCTLAGKIIGVYTERCGQGARAFFLLPDIGATVADQAPLFQECGTKWMKLNSGKNTGWADSNLFEACPAKQDESSSGFDYETLAIVGGSIGGLLCFFCSIFCCFAYCYLIKRTRERKAAIELANNPYANQSAGTSDFAQRRRRASSDAVDGGYAIKTDYDRDSFRRNNSNTSQNSATSTMQLPSGYPNQHVTPTNGSAWGGASLSPGTSAGYTASAGYQNPGAEFNSGPSYPSSQISSQYGNLIVDRSNSKAAY